MASQNFDIKDGLLVTTANVTSTLTVGANVAVDTNVLKVDTVNNRVGVNITSPTEALDVSGDIAASGNVSATYFVGDGSQLTGVNAGSATTLGGFTSSQYLRSDAADSLEDTLTVAASGSGKIIVGSSSQIQFNDNASAVFGSTSDGSIKYNTSTSKVEFNCGTTNLTITSPTSTFSANVVAANFNTTSDSRLKSDIQIITGALDIVKSLRGVSYNKNGSAEIGVIAQEIQEHLPQVVTENDEGYLSVAYGNIVGLLIEAIKELEKKIDNK